MLSSRAINTKASGNPCDLANSRTENIRLHCKYVEHTMRLGSNAFFYPYPGIKHPTLRSSYIDVGYRCVEVPRGVQTTIVP